MIASGSIERVAYIHRRRKLTDKELPNSLKHHETFAGEAQMYHELLEMERKLDWTMMRKKVEIEDALTRVQPVRQLSSLHP